MELRFQTLERSLQVNLYGQTPSWMSIWFSALSTIMLSHLMSMVLISLYIHPPKKNNQHYVKNRDTIHDSSDALTAHGQHLGWLYTIKWGGIYVWRIMEATQTALKRTGYTKHSYVKSTADARKLRIINLFIFLIDFLTWCFIYNISLSYCLSYRFYAIPGTTEFCEALDKYFEIKYLYQVKLEFLKRYIFFYQNH